MNKKTLIFPALILILITGSCGPAAENREAMHSRAKVIADSIANMIKTKMQEAETPANTSVVQDTSAKKTNTISNPK